MAVKIKLKRLGKIREPYYRIVVADARTKRDGRAIEEIGKYHPKAEPSLIEVNSERVQHWLSVGAQPTDPVRVLLKVTGDWQKFTGEPGAEGTLRTAAPREDRRERFAAAAKASQASKDTGDKASGSGKATARAARPARDGSAQGGRAKAAPAKAGDAPAQAETARVETARAETAQAETAQAETAQAETAQAETAQAETAQAETAQAETAQAETRRPRQRRPRQRRPRQRRWRRRRLRRAPASQGVRPDVLEEALEHLVRGIVQYPDDVRVRSRALRRGSVLEVRVHSDDLGKVIGRGGRTARALRTVITALASGRYVRIDFLDVAEVR